LRLLTSSPTSLAWGARPSRWPFSASRRGRDGALRRPPARAFLSPAGGRNSAGQKRESASGDIAAQCPYPKRQRAGALQDAARSSFVTGQRASVLDCGGKRSATPLSHARKSFALRIFLVRPKAPSPLRSAGALQIRPPQTAITPVCPAAAFPTANYLEPSISLY
jgi:hypothetical protein